ncbi:MAG: IS4 family transposase [Pirellulaceae bacterium]|nr:IS4 family transposase [Pirellulaceae bacterium]
MKFTNILQRFIDRSPACVMIRATMENVVTPDLLDSIFEKTARRQYCRELLFSSVVDLLGLVVTGVRKSVNEAYQADKERFAVSVISVYDKLKRVETEVSREMVRQTAQRMSQVIRRLQPRERPRLLGYRTKIIDGNHLSATEHRIAELRKTRQGPLPGQALVVLEPDLMLATDVFPCEDGHAQERSLLPQVLETVQPKDLWIADRNFCTTEFLFGIVRRQGAFLIRQHASTLRYELVGERRNIGRCPTGMIYQQQMRLFHPDDSSMLVRRVTIELNKPTRNGDREIHLLTNLPLKKADSRTAAELYLGRWTVENAFQELGQALHSEIKTLGYPKAALLSFCIALLAYNVISVVKTALFTAHGTSLPRERVSGYYLAGEIAATYHGMLIAVPARQWRGFGEMTPSRLANSLLYLARKIHPSRFMKNIRGPKKPRPKRVSGIRHPHVSTARLLAQRKQRKVHSVTA